MNTDPATLLVTHTIMNEFNTNLGEFSYLLYWFLTAAPCLQKCIVT